MISVLPQLDPSEPILSHFSLVCRNSFFLLLGQATVIDLLEPSNKNLTKTLVDLSLLSSV